MPFLLSYHVWVTSKIQVTCLFKRFLRLPKQKCSKFISSRAKVDRGTVTRPTLFCQLYCHVTSCHVMQRHATSYHVMSRHATSCHVMSRHATSCHVTSRHVTSRHATSCHVMSRRKSRTVTRPALHCQLTFHTQLIQIRHNRVCWLSRRVPIPYRISGI